MKPKIFVTALFILVFSALFLSKSVNAQDAAELVVFVYKYMTEATPQQGAEVVLKQNGNQITSGETNSSGSVSFDVPDGTYDIYTYYPSRPNDGQSAQKIGFVLVRNGMVKLHLGPNY